MNADRQKQLRKVAILVASLDESLSERMLANLPAREEEAVRKIVEQLEEIDSAEYRAAVADFHHSNTAPSHRQTEPPRAKLEGVELDDSLLALMAAEDSSKATQTSKDNMGAWQTLSDADVSTLVEMLSAEQPQTIAVVLSRLGTSQAAELISKLSPSMQGEVLTRLADLDPADEQTLQVVASQLAAWIHEQRRRHQRMSAGRDMVQRILQSTSEGQRTAMLTQLNKRNPALAKSLSQNPLGDLQRPGKTEPSNGIGTSSKKPSTPSDLGQSVDRPRGCPPESYRQRTGVQQTGVMSPPSGNPLEPTRSTEDPLSTLESLEDQALLNALRQADRQTVMLALAGASEGLMKRIVRGLPRRQANQFRQQVRAIGPVRLSEMLAAQHELVRFGQIPTAN